MIKRINITPVILWTGDDEWITTAERISSGQFDQHLPALLTTTAVYRDLLLRDPEGKQLADPDQAALVDAGWRSLTNRYMQIEDPITALVNIAQIQLAILQ